jgi:hypothetical protein
MRPRALLVLAVLAVLASAACGRKPSWLGGPVCPEDPDLDRSANVEVVVSSFTTTVRHDLDMAAVARLPGTEALGPGGKLQGLTIVHHQVNYKTGVALTRPLFGGPACAWIDKLTVDMTPDQSEIFVPSEYPEESCEYDQILLHERSHDETHRDALAEAADALRRALAKASGLPARGTPIAVADRAEAERRIEAAVDKAEKPVYADFQDALRRRQAVIDLPENYVWTARRCSHWK